MQIGKISDTSHMLDCVAYTQYMHIFSTQLMCASNVVMYVTWILYRKHICRGSGADVPAARKKSTFRPPEFVNFICYVVKKIHQNPIHSIFLIACEHIQW